MQVENDLPLAIIAQFPVNPSRNIITVNDEVYIIKYSTVSTGLLLGQGGTTEIIDSSFSFGNPSSTAKFIFTDPDIFNSASVVGQFKVYLAPTFEIGAVTYWLDAANLVVTDNDKRPYPFLENPAMFSIDGLNYVIDGNRTPHVIIGNNQEISLSTDVTVEKSKPIPHSLFTLEWLHLCIRFGRI